MPDGMKLDGGVVSKIWQWDVLDAFERILDSFVRSIPGYAVAACAVVLYGAGGLAVPLVLHWRIAFLVEANLIGTSLAAVLCLAWLVAQVQTVRRHQLLEWTTSLRLLDASEFEWLVGELFRREGWAVKELGRVGEPDGNIDLELSRGSDRRLVQCKRWTSWAVGVDDIRSFAGTLMRERLNGDAGIFVTFSRFTEQALNEAHELGITVLDNHSLLKRIDKARRSEPCPECGHPMLLDHSKWGWWLRCRKLGCAGKRDLGRDAGRAAQLLIESNASL